MKYCARYFYLLVSYLSVCLLLLLYAHLQATPSCYILSLQKVFTEYDYNFGDKAVIQDLKNYRIKNDQRLSRQLYELIYKKMHKLDGDVADRLETFIDYYKQYNEDYNDRVLWNQLHNVPQKNFNRDFSKKLANFIIKILE